MTTALFFAADGKTKTFLKKHPISGIKYEYADFDINSNQVMHISAPQDVEIISVFAHAQPIDNRKLDYFTHLKMIATRSTGFNHIDLAYCQSRNIIVSNVPNYGSTSVAEFTIGSMLGLMRHIPLAKSQLKTNNVFLPAYMGESIKGKTVGIIGTGAIGRAVIKILEAFRATILPYDPFPCEALIKKGITYATSLTELYQKSDIISLHCPATDENYHLLDENAFNLMKKGVYIINTARGSLIDTNALYHALLSGKVAGAALDVLENEDVVVERDISTDMEKNNTEILLDSLINLKMLQLNNTLITPHIAFNSTDAIDAILSTTFENIKAFLAGTPINCVP